MPQKHKNNRDQLLMVSLAEHVPQDSMARVIDAFIQSVDPSSLGFKNKGQSREGRPAYPSDVLVKLYLYGYFNGIRSSRKLEKACKVNIELWWLLANQKPHYKTIANFRKDNAEGFANLFIHFRIFCLNLDLYGKSTVAIDGSKFRAQNSKKNNYIDRKINKHLDYIDHQYQEYINQLNTNDKYDEDHRIKNNLEQRKKKYENLKDQLSNSDQTQISTTDPDARALPPHMRIVEVGYNLQSAVDDKHNLVVDYDITNKNDHRALAPMAIKAKNALQINENDTLTVLADKGYHTGEQLETCHDNHIETLVAIPNKPKQTDRSKPPHLRKENFIYNPKSDSYTCPNGETLTKQTRFKRRTKKGLPAGQFDRYAIRYSICKHCPFLEQCVSKGNRSGHKGRYLDRYLTDHAVERNKININNNRGLYKKRQAIVEHPFGTIKRQWGYTYTLLKTIPKVKTEFSIIMLCYNIKRTMSIIGSNKLKNELIMAFYSFFSTCRSMKRLIVHLTLKRLSLSHHHLNFLYF